jgi:hypothetical protein
MKITKQLLEEMVEEELNEGKLQNFLATLGIAGTLYGLGVAGSEIASRVEARVVEDSVEKLLHMDQAQVDELEKNSPGGNETINKVWTQYRARKAAQPSSETPMPENRSRLERIIAEELRKVLKA